MIGCGTCSQMGDLLMRVAERVRALPPEEQFRWRKEVFERVTGKPYPHATMEEERAAGGGTYE